MRSIKILPTCLCLAVVLTGCAGREVICDGRLVPINLPERVAAGGDAASATTEMPHSLPVRARTPRPVTSAP